MEIEKVEKVDHPSHYNKGNIEVIDFIEDQEFEFNLGNAVKYICRSRHNGNFSQDIDKAIWYLDRASGKNRKTIK